MTEIASNGYEDTKIIGRDASGARISGTNEDYSLSIPATDVPEDDLECAQFLFEQYKMSKASGQIKVEKRDDKIVENQLREIHKKHG